MPEKLLNDEISSQVKQLFETGLVNPVELLFFYDKTGCDTCDEAGQLLDELVELSGHLTLHKYDVGENSDIAHQYNVEHVPALVIASRHQGETYDYGVRFLGIPSGYEFSSLIHAIEFVSKRDSGLKPESRAALKNITSPLLLKVFVTPT